MSLDRSGRNALVTGAARRIGAAAAVRKSPLFHTTAPVLKTEALLS